jgi:hypothetical protein
MIFHSVGNGIIIPSDVHSMIFQRGRAQPPTSPQLDINQIYPKIGYPKKM